MFCSLTKDECTTGLTVLKRGLPHCCCCCCCLTLTLVKHLESVAAQRCWSPRMRWPRPTPPFWRLCPVHFSFQKLMTRGTFKSSRIKKRVKGFRRGQNSRRTVNPERQMRRGSCSRYIVLRSRMIRAYPP